ncbi:MAG: NAD(P)-binding protein [Pseudomonadales bacterium]|nr:NAD(P)-binding protein [Pseudomonadales bacterium]
MKKILVVGAGFAGATVAREIAESGYFVDVIDSRYHVAGNAYDPVSERTGQRYHLFGPHIFHTNSKEIVDYLSKYTEWLPYIHKVQAILPTGITAPIPVNLTTLNTLFDLELASESDMRAFLNKKRLVIDAPRNAEEYLQNIYGEEITELFFSRYTTKMWDIELSDLPSSVVKRMPVRYDSNENYFNDAYQLMPKNGYETLIRNMLSHSNIEVTTSVQFSKDMQKDYYHTFNSMSVDEYFDQCFGPLPYRSVVFEHRYNETFAHDVPTVNFTNTDSYTRKSDWSLYPGCGGERGAMVTYERPCSYEKNNFERYYPVKTVNGWPQARYLQYKKCADKLEDITFIGRCGQYIYYDMHQVVANSLAISKSFLCQS